MPCDGTEVAALIDWEIWSLSDPRLDLAWFLFFTDEAKHPMASNPGPTGMPTAQALLDAYVEESGAVPANLEWFHCLIRYKEAAATALLMKRFVKSGGDAGAPWTRSPAYRRVHRPPATRSPRRRRRTGVSRADTSRPDDAGSGDSVEGALRRVRGPS